MRARLGRHARHRADYLQLRGLRLAVLGLIASSLLGVLARVLLSLAMVALAAWSGAGADMTEHLSLRPGRGDPPRMQPYDVLTEAGDKKLLDLLMGLRVQDDSLSFRRSCREGCAARTR